MESTRAILAITIGYLPKSKALTSSFDKTGEYVLKSYWNIIIYEKTRIQTQCLANEKIVQKNNDEELLQKLYNLLEYENENDKEWPIKTT